MALVIASRWHTVEPKQPQQDAPPPPTFEKCIGPQNKHAPLYHVMTTIVDNPNTSDAVRKVLENFINGFDDRISVVRIPSWDKHFVLRLEYEALYGQRPDENDMPISRVIGRLISYKDIFDELRQMGRDPNAFFNPPPEVKRGPTASDPPQFNGSSRRVNQKLGPVFATQLDPLHSWGTFTRNLNNVPMRWEFIFPEKDVLMRCCHEHVDQTQGCWISLDSTQEPGKPIPYALLYVDHWDALASTKKMAHQLDFRSEWQIGTAFRDVDFYIQTHDNIQRLLNAVADQLRNAYVAYITRLDAAVQAVVPLPLPMDPFEHDLNQDGQQKLITLLQTYFIYNEVHGMTAPANWAQYINANVFRVPSATNVWTGDRRNVAMFGTQLITLLLSSEVSPDNVIGDLINAIGSRPYAAFISSTYRGYASDYHRFVVPKVKLVEEVRALQGELGRTVDYEQRIIDGSNIMRNGLITFQIETNASVRGRLAAQTTFNEETPGWIAARNTIVAQSKNYDAMIAYVKTLNVESARKNLLVERLSRWINTQDASGYNPIAKSGSILESDVRDIDVALMNDNGSKVSPNSTLKYSSTELDAISIANGTLYAAISQNNAILTDTRSELVHAVRIIAIVNDAPSSYSSAIRDEAQKKNAIVVRGLALHTNASGNTANISKAKRDAIAKYDATIRIIEAGVLKREKAVRDAAIAFLNGWGFPSGGSYTADMETFNGWISAKELLEVPGMAKELDVIRASAYVPIRENYENMKLAKNAINLDAPGNEAKKQAAVNYNRVLDNIQNTFWLGDVRAYLKNVVEGKENKVSPDGTHWVALLDEQLAVFETPAQRAKREEEERQRERLDQERMAQATAALVNVIAWIADETVGTPSIAPLTELNNYINSHPVETAAIEKNKLFPLKLRLENASTLEYTGKSLVDFLWVEGVDMGELFKTYDLLVQYYIHAQHDAARIARRDAFLAQVSKLVLVEQPYRQEYVSGAKIPITNTTLTMPPMETNGTSSFNQSVFKWEGNSCWIDSAMLALFNVPETSWNRYLFQRQLDVYTSFLQLQFPSGKTFSLNPTCGADEMTTLHMDLLRDIQTIEAPSTTGAICNSRPNWFNYGRCLKTALTRGVGEEEDPATFFESLVAFYGSDNLKIQYDHKITSRTDAVISPLGAKPGMNAYILQVDYQPEEGEDVNTEYVVDETRGYKLAAVLGFGHRHVISLVKDFVSGKWTYFNHTNYTQITEQLTEPVPTGMNSVRNGFRDFIPICYVFYSDTEVKRIRDTVAQFAPPPSSSETPWEVQDSITGAALAASSPTDASVVTFIATNNQTASLDVTLAEMVGLYNARGEQVTRWSLDDADGSLPGVLVIDRDLWNSPQRRAPFLYMQRLVATTTNTADPQFQENIRHAIVASHFKSPTFAKNTVLADDLGLVSYPTDSTIKPIVDEYVAFSETPLYNNTAYRAEYSRITKLRIRKV